MSYFVSFIILPFCMHICNAEIYAPYFEEYEEIKKIYQSGFWLDLQAAMTVALFVLAIIYGVYVIGVPFQIQRTIERSMDNITPYLSPEFMDRIFKSIQSPPEVPAPET